jgi:hypothetical protein
LHSKCVSRFITETVTNIWPCNTNGYDKGAENGIKKKLREELDAYFSLIRHGTQKKMPLTIIFCLGNVFSEILPSYDREIHREIHRHASNNSSFAACVLCRGNDELLPAKRVGMPINDRRDTHTDTQTDWRGL